MQTVVYTSVFLKAASQLGVDEEEMMRIVSAIAADPVSGDVVQGTGGARRRRFAKGRSGKSGGYRTIHFFGGLDIPVFLLTIYGKGDKANLTKAERNGLAEILGNIADQYRATEEGRLS